MPAYLEHDITLASFAQIQQEMAAHSLTPAEFSVVRRVIHTSADFDFQRLVHFAHQPIAAATAALTQGVPIVTDVSMVAAGITAVAARTWQSAVTVAVQQAPGSLPASQPGLPVGSAQQPGSSAARPSADPKRGWNASVFAAAARRHCRYWECADSITRTL